MPFQGSLAIKTLTSTLWNLSIPYQERALPAAGITNLFAPRFVTANSTMNPYVAGPDQIPATDLYADVPLYGRYLPRPDDFKVDPQHINSHSADSLQYWASVVDLCNESARIYPADEAGRDVFVLGSIIVKSSHLHETTTEIDYSYADANEVQAVALARSISKAVRVPDIYFAGKVSIPS